MLIRQRRGKQLQAVMLTETGRLVLAAGRRQGPVTIWGRDMQASPLPPRSAARPTKSASVSSQALTASELWVKMAIEGDICRFQELMSHGTFSHKIELSKSCRAMTSLRNDPI